MNSISKTILRILVLALFSLLMLSHSWAMAAEEGSSAAMTGKSPCTTGMVDCHPAMHSAAHLQTLSRQECARESQDCDYRSKAMRTRADRESRDRHSCRD
jgi:hypothetical protein